MSYVWINGQLVDKSEAKISVFDHGFLYGDGVWEHFRAFGGKLFRPNWGFCNLLRHFPWLKLPFTESEMVQAAESTLAANNRSEGYLRVIVTRGCGTIGPDPRKLEPQAIIIAEEYRPYPDELYEGGLDLVTCRLDLPNTWLIHDKTLNQWHRVHAKTHALNNGCFDALLVNGTDMVHGTTEGDLFVLHREQVWRNSTSWDESFRDFLHDVPKLLRHEWCGVHLKQFELSFATTAEEAFVAGTSCGIIAVSKIDGKPIGSGTEGPITKQIREAYRKLTRGET